MSSFNPCSFCNANCCKDCTITVTSFDVVRIASKTGKTPEEFATIVPARLLNQDNSTVLECYGPGGKGTGASRGIMHEHILALRSHPCCFLGKDNLCKIHDFEPYGCRKYPMGPDGKVVSRAFCHPISKLMFGAFGSHLDQKEYASQLESYRNIVRKWNSKRGKLEECMEFLIKETK